MSDFEQLQADLATALSKVNLPTLLSPARAAQELDIGLTTLHQLIKEGTINTVQVGKRRKVPGSEVIRLASFRRREDAPVYKPTQATGRTGAAELRLALRNKH